VSVFQFFVIGLKQYCDFYIMKHVDSKTSLAELNPEDPTCFVCLETSNEEPVVPSKMLRNCGCVFVVHPSCWNEYMKDKSDYDCPICRKKSYFSDRPPTPLQEFLAANPEQEQSHPRTYILLFVLGIVAVIAITLFFILTKNN